MTDTEETIKRLRLLRNKYECLTPQEIKAIENYEDCRNELCLKCGRYKESHLGACKGCRWETV